MFSTKIMSIAPRKQAGESETYRRNSEGIVPLAQGSLEIGVGPGVELRSLDRQK